MRGHVRRRRPPRARSKDRGGPQPIPGPRRGAMRGPGAASVLARGSGADRDAGESRRGRARARTAGPAPIAARARTAGPARAVGRRAEPARVVATGAGPVRGRGAPRGAGAGSGAGAGRGGSGAGAGAGRGASLGGGATTGGSIESGSRYACRVPASRTPKCRWGWTAERVPRRADRAQALAGGHVRARADRDRGQVQVRGVEAVAGPHAHGQARRAGRSRQTAPRRPPPPHRRAHRRRDVDPAVLPGGIGVVAVPVRSDRHRPGPASSTKRVREWRGEGRQ